MYVASDRSLIDEDRLAMERLLLSQKYVDVPAQIEGFLNSCSNRFYESLKYDSTDYRVGGYCYEDWDK